MKHTAHDITPLAFRHFPDCSELELFLPDQDRWVPVAEIRESEYVNPEITAEFYVKAINSYAEHIKFISAVVDVLKLCLGCNLTGDVRQKALTLNEKAKREFEVK